MQRLSSDIGVILADHGSVVSEANEMLVEVVTQFRETAGAAIVEPAHMDLAEPTIEQAFARCVAQGARRVVVHPYFLTQGRHGTQDIPRMTAAAARMFPGVSYCVTEPLGPDRRMLEIILERVLAALAKENPQTP
jgi:sirohydrochlorin ferrochelatase